MVCSINNTDLHVIKVMPNQQDNCQLHQLHHLHQQQQQQTQESSPSSLSSSSPIVSNHECKRVHFEGDHSIISVPLNNLNPYSCNSSPVYCPGNHYHSNQHGHHLHHHHHHHCQHQQSINQVTNFSSTECSENGDEHEEENGNETVEGKDENEVEEEEEEEEEILIENIDSACFIQVDQSLLMSINRENIEPLKDKSEISSVSYEDSKGSMQSNVKTGKPGNQTLDSTSVQPIVPATSSVDPNCPINKHITINPLEVCYHQFNGNNGNTQDQCNDESKLHQNQVYSHQQSNSTLDNLSSHFSHPLQNNNHFISCHHYLNHHSHPTYQHYHHHHHQQKQLQTSDVDTDDQPSSSPGLSENSFNHLRPVETNTTVPVTDTLLSHLEPHQHEHYPSAPFMDSFCDSCCHKMDKQRLNTANRNSDVEHFISTNCLSQQQPFEITPNEPCFLCSTSQPSSSSLTLLPTSGHPHYHHCSLLSSHPSTSTTLPMKSVKSVKHRPTVRFATKPSNSYPTESPTLTPACHPCDTPCKHVNHFQHSNDVLDHQDKVKLSTHSSTNCNNKLANNIYSYNPVELPKEPPINHEGVSYLPIIIVATILTITTVLLVIASIFFIKYLPFQKSLSSYEGICSCAFGGYCSPDSYSDNIASICRCDTFQCDSTPFDPICANDNKTYSNQCQLNFTSCNLQTPLTVQYKGKCEENGETNACGSIKCDNETICIQTSPDSPGICSCPSCSHHYEPVCASDGLFYTNECVLRRESCKENLNLRIVHSNECGGCDNVHCQFYSNCDITETGEVSCHCPKNCSQEKDPVCGSDGLNYLNECQLRLTSCQQRQYITVTSKVQCDLCSNVHCKYGAHCEAGLCVCPKDCPSIYEPVCSTDGYTYANECQMRLTACQRKLELSVTFYGECQDSQMIKRLGSTSPSSPSSSLSSFTFTASSPSSNSLTGYIDTCDQNTCRFGGVCDYDATGIPHCVCSYSCPVRDESRDEFVCGSDGRLYENECKLQEEACRRQQEVALESRDKCDGQRLLSLCDSSQPLVDPLTGLDYTCGDGPGAKICPAFSYCQKDGYHAKCCPDVALKVNCNSSTYGCCSDGLVSALGWNLAGCPEVCNCNKLGSISSTCDPITNQCQCKVGVGGLQCDRCKPGFWGLHKISEGNNGCIPCSCNKNGSVRGDCEQMTGRCVCKQGLQGVKCDICPEDALLLPQGCTHVNLTKLYPESCSTINCLFGAKCESLDEGGSRCVCNIDCSPEEKSSDKVCSSDGTIFPNECQLKIYSCRMQRPLTTLYKGPCKLFESSNTNNDKDNNNNDIETITQGPLRRSTVYKTATTLVDTFKSIRQTTYINLTSSSSSSSSSSPSPSTVSSSSSPYLPLNTIFSVGTSKTPSSTPTPNKSSIISIPGFLGNSLIELPRLQAYSRLSIEMEFISYTESAILLYNGQTVSGEGDFVSLSIRKGHIEFRYDLGSGMVILRSKEPIVIGSTVRFVAKRYHKDGILSVEGQPDVTGSSPGSLKSLDLAENLYLGWISTNRSNVYNNIGLRSAFIGCLYRFNVDKNLRLKDILDPSTSTILRSVNVIDCLDMPCSGSSVQRLSSSVNYCHNGGTCLPLISSTDGSISSSCKCKPGYTGETCKLTIGDNICSMDNNPCIKDTVCASLPFNQGFSCFCPQDDNSLELCLNAQRKTENAFIPDFVETSYLTLPTLQNIAQTFIIEIWFLSRDINGMLFYNGQHSSHAKGDFISLNIVDSFIQFSFNLGSINPSESGLVTLRSESKISIGEWHSVRITRNRKQGGLQLDQHSMVYGEAKTNLSELNLDQPFYIGSIPGSHSTHREFNISKGFNGAIQRIVVNGHVWDDLLDRAIEIYNVAKYVGPPCESPNPCSSSNAVCVPQFNHYTCKCNSPDYSIDCTSDIPQEQ